MCSKRRQKELKDLINERRVDIFGALETKLKYDKRHEMQNSWADNWVLVNNGDDLIQDACDSICVRWC